MQEPLDNLSENARVVHDVLGDESLSMEEVSAKTELPPGEAANALRELQAAQRAAETFGGWSIIR